MNKLIRILQVSTLLLLQCALFQVSTVQAQSEDLGLCPSGYDQGIVSTTFVECHRESSHVSTREEAELLRIQREAVCNAHPNSIITSSEIVGDSEGRYYARLICTVTRAVPPGTTLCPDNSEEVYRAFDQLVCQYFGDADLTVQEAQQSLATQISECNATTGGVVIESELKEGSIDDLTFYFASLACGLPTAATDIIECPFGFDENNRDENTIECSDRDDAIETLAEAQAKNQTSQSICTDTTAGLGTVSDSRVEAETSNSKFFSLVVCDIKIPRYGDFRDATVVRACDNSCTEDIEQVRACLNGGTVGGPGCTQASSRVVTRRCNTGPERDGLCPLALAPMTIIPSLLLDDE